jgi:hypothetical protein
MHGQTLFIDFSEHEVQVLTWYQAFKRRCPSLSAYFLLPAKGLRNAEWIPYLRHMKLKRISTLVSGACLHLTAEGLWKPYQKEMCVMYDAPWQQVNAMSNPIQDALASEGLCMQYVGALAKVPVNVLFDTGAEQSFVSASFLRSAGLWPKVVGRRVPSVTTAANGTAVQIEGEITCELKLSDHVSTVHCLVADLGIDHEVILGQPWLHEQQAVLSVGCLQVTVGLLPTKRVVLQCSSSRTPVDRSGADTVNTADGRAECFKRATLISAVKCKRLVRKKQVDRLFAVQITREGNIVAEPEKQVSADASDPVKDAIMALVDELHP